MGGLHGRRKGVEEAMSKFTNALGTPTTKEGRSTAQSQSKLLKARSAESTSTHKRMGRPPGKRTNPDFRQVTAWVRKDTYDDVTVALVKQDRKEFSNLVQELLDSWLEPPR